jgi:hypothetical protein
MRVQHYRASIRAFVTLAGLMALWALAPVSLVALAPVSASAQYSAPELGGAKVVGEKYHVEVSGSLWTPALFGVISSEQFGIQGTSIDFVTDLGYQKTRFTDLRLVLRPSKKGRFKIQNTPIQYTSETLLERNIVFNGIEFPVSLPVQSTFGWNVWRVGYEYDFVYTSRGFVGVLLEARYTDFNAELRSALGSEFTALKGPLPAIGAVGRVYVLPALALNFEVSGMQVPNIDPKYQGSYFDWDVHGTFNINNYMGLQVGWRRISTLINVDSDKGDLKFQGMWFGAALRY